MTGLGSGHDFTSVCGAPSNPGEVACTALLRTNIKAHKGITPNTAPAGYGPADLQSAYDLPSSTAGTGETVAVVDAGDDPTAEADLGIYRAQYGLPPCTTANGCFEKVNQEGQQGDYPPVDGEWPLEESLDVDMVSAACPNCHILLVEANSAAITDLGASEDEAVALGAKYISNSYSTSDQADELQWDAYYNHPGVVITASAGDDGYGVGYPSASQYVTSVGGTSLTQDSSVPRGWTETAWGSAAGGEGTGSGCSGYEPKPTWQKDTGCANRTVADVSADANPNTGAAVYATSGGEDGWLVVGGTSLSSPFIASVYALAGPPVAGTYPSSYPYADPSALNDITSGANGTCTPAYLCTAGPGYDGPTGLGTPDGVNAFSGGPHGDITGRVTDASTGKSLADAQVSAAGGSAVTNADGDYNLVLPTGNYNVTAADYGYQSQTTDGVAVSDGTTTTENYALTAEQTSIVSGTVTDGSGHDWPLYASVTVEGTPGAPVYTNPYTGAYAVALPQNSTYTLQVTPVEPGYQTTTQQVSLGNGSMTKNIAVPVDPTIGCVASGYQNLGSDGITEQFTGWNASTPQDGWTVTGSPGGNGDTWVFGTDPTNRGAILGTQGQYAIADGGFYPGIDTTLTSPVIDLSGTASPAIAFDTYYVGFTSADTGDVDISLDGGQAWTTAWQQTSATVTGVVVIPIPQAAGQSDVRVRFHYVGSDVGAYWALDNVAVGGNANCNPVHGGMVSGIVRDGNTRQRIDGAEVANVSVPSVGGITAAPTKDPYVPGGFYEFFSPLTGRQQFAAVNARYQPQAKVIKVAVNAVTKANFTLSAGRVSVTPSLTGKVKIGGSTGENLTIKNSGTMPADVTIGQQSGSFTPVAENAVQKSMRPASWAPIPGNPFSSETESVAGYDYTNGKLYTAGGIRVPGSLASVNTASVFDPQTQLWSSITPMPVAVTGATAQFLDSKFYVFGGVETSFGQADDNYALQIYNPATNKWQVQSGGPTGSDAFAASATLNGDLYVVGGCSKVESFGINFPSSQVMCESASDSAARYDSLTRQWTPIANYPLYASDLACGGVAGELVCTGGLDDRASFGNPRYWVTDKSTYIYNPATNTWSPGASLPVALWGMSYGAANGQLLVSDGVAKNSTVGSTQGFAYQPSTNIWKRLPDTPTFRFMEGSACGFFQVGGADQSPGIYPASSEELPGYDQCGDDGTQVPWLAVTPSEVTVPADGSVNVKVTLNGSGGITQPGTYTADLDLISNTPQTTPTVAVTMNVTPPKSWGQIAGTVYSTACGGTTSPLAGATVQIDSWAGDDTLITSSSGQYELWLDRRSNPLTLIVAKNGWRSQSRKVKIAAGHATTANFTLTPQACS